MDHIEDLDQLGDELLECFLMPKRFLQHLIQTFLLCLQLLTLATSCKLAIKELKQWMAPKEVPVPPIALPGTAFVVPEPLGVALVIAPWNFPICKSKVCLLSQRHSSFVSLS
jgi:hypothetical protein